MTTEPTPSSDGHRQNGSRSPHPVFWVIAGALVTIAVVLLCRGEPSPFANVALGQSGGVVGARGVFAFSGQLTKGTYGVYMVDADTMTIWAYEYLPQKGCMRLVGARTWRYDRYLENYNICDLPPDVVEQMVQEQREHRLQETETSTP